MKKVFFLLMLNFFLVANSIFSISLSPDNMETVENAACITLLGVTLASPKALSLIKNYFSKKKRLLTVQKTVEPVPVKASSSSERLSLIIENSPEKIEALTLKYLQEQSLQDPKMASELDIYNNYIKNLTMREYSTFLRQEAKKPLCLLGTIKDQNRLNKVIDYLYKTMSFNNDYIVYNKRNGNIYIPLEKKYHKQVFKNDNAPLNDFQRELKKHIWFFKAGEEYCIDSLENAHSNEPNMKESNMDAQCLIVEYHSKFSTLKERRIDALKKFLIPIDESCELDEIKQTCQELIVPYLNSKHPSYAPTSISPHIHFVYDKDNKKLWLLNKESYFHNKFEYHLKAIKEKEVKRRLDMFFTALALPMVLAKVWG